MAQGLISQLAELTADHPDRNRVRLSQMLRQMKADKTAALVGGVRVAAGPFTAGHAQSIAAAQWPGRVSARTDQFRNDVRKQQPALENTVVTTPTIAECAAMIVCVVFAVTVTNGAATLVLLNILVAISVAEALACITILTHIPLILDLIGCHEAAQWWNANFGNQEWFRTRSPSSYS